VVFIFRFFLLDFRASCQAPLRLARAIAYLTTCPSSHRRRQSVLSQNDEITRSMSNAAFGRIGTLLTTWANLKSLHVGNVSIFLGISLGISHYSAYLHLAITKPALNPKISISCVTSICAGVVFASFKSLLRKPPRMVMN